MGFSRQEDRSGLSFPPPGDLPNPGVEPGYTSFPCIDGRVASDSLRPPGLQPARLLCPWDSPGKNTGVGYHVLLWTIFLTQGLTPYRVLYGLRWQVGSSPALSGKPGNERERPVSGAQS